MSKQSKTYRIAGRPQTIYRVVKSADNPYVMIDRRPIENPVLSFKAKGILAYLLSRPDGWEVSVADLINKATDGEDSVRSGLKELEKAGHMKRTRTRAAGVGTYTGLLIEVYEVPQADFRHVDKPDVDKPDVDKPDVENPTQVLSNLSNTEIKNNEAVTVVSVACSDNLIKVKRSMIVKAVDTYPAQWILDAIRESCTANVLKWNYALAILARWKEEGREEREYHTRKAQTRKEVSPDNLAVIKSIAVKRMREAKTRHEAYTDADLKAAELINSMR